MRTAIRMEMIEMTTSNSMSVNPRLLPIVSPLSRSWCLHLKYRIPENGLVFQIFRYFQGLEDMEEVSDLDPREKARMLVASLGFSPEGDGLSLFEGKRPALRIRDLRS